MKNTQAVPPQLQDMLKDYKKYGEDKYTSNLWVYTNNQSINDLLIHSYDTFKSTIATNHFTFINESNISLEIISQWDFLIDNLGFEELINTLNLTQKKFDIITLLLWKYVKTQGFEKELTLLSEPLEGSPPGIIFEDRLISQDLANSLLEYDSINKNIRPGSIRSILDIGAGYGRSAYVWLLLDKIEKYIIIDIPPALYISQRYLANQFPEKKVFRYRDFKSFDGIKAEFEQADIVFLMPWQIGMLPDKSIDLIFSIDALNEMKLVTIKSYLKEVNRLGKKYFYLKSREEWKSEGVTIKRKDWPIPQEWGNLLNRECRVQTRYFESLYELPQ